MFNDETASNKAFFPPKQVERNLQNTSQLYKSKVLGKVVLFYLTCRKHKEIELTH